MNGNQGERSDLLDTTDCLEAVGVFKGWKNFLFVIVVCCLLLLQIFFWLVDTGRVKAKDENEAAETTLEVITPPPAHEPAIPIKEEQTKQSPKTPNKTEKAAEQVSEEPSQPTEEESQEPNQPVEAAPKEPNQPAEAAPKEPNQPAEAAPKEPPQQASPRIGIKFEHLAKLIRFFNFVLILTATLYCLTVLFSLKVSLLGQLGGISHISRAFFLSLFFLVLLLPWQEVFPDVVVGAIYTPDELASSCAAEPSGIFGVILHYLRFTGYWLLVVLLLIFSHLRSIRWTKAILRRLEVM